MTLKVKIPNGKYDDALRSMRDYQYNVIIRDEKGDYYSYGCSKEYEPSKNTAKDMNAENGISARIFVREGNKILYKGKEITDFDPCFQPEE